MEVTIPIDKGHLEGILQIPDDAKGIVLFAHGSGSGRYSVRNQYVASILNDAMMATLLFDLLTPDEEAIDNVTRHLRFDIPFLVSRLITATEWARHHRDTKDFSIGYFGASTGGAAALVAAAKNTKYISAVVSRGGRPDLAGDAILPIVKAPTLLIVGGDDEPVIEMNKSAMKKMTCPTKLEIIPGATHLFEEPGKLETVAILAKDWFLTYFSKA